MNITFFPIAQSQIGNRSGIFGTQIAETEANLTTLLRKEFQEQKWSDTEATIVSLQDDEWKTITFSGDIERVAAHKAGLVTSEEVRGEVKTVAKITGWQDGLIVPAGIFAVVMTAAAYRNDPETLDEPVGFDYIVITFLATRWPEGPPPFAAATWLRNFGHSLSSAQEFYELESARDSARKTEEYNRLFYPCFYA